MRLCNIAAVNIDGRIKGGRVLTRPKSRIAEESRELAAKGSRGYKCISNQLPLIARAIGPLAGTLRNPDAASGAFSLSQTLVPPVRIRPWGNVAHTPET